MQGDADADDDDDDDADDDVALHGGQSLHAIIVVCSVQLADWGLVPWFHCQ